MGRWAGRGIGALDRRWGFDRGQAGEQHARGGRTQASSIQAHLGATAGARRGPWLLSRPLELELQDP